MLKKLKELSGLYKKMVPFVVKHRVLTVTLLVCTLCFLTGIAIRFTYISDKAELTVTRVRKVVHPRSLAELTQLVKETRSPLSIAGARYSQGGQIAYPEGTVINMSGISRVRNLDVKKKLITVEAGATWRSIQEYIDPYNLSVKVMQSYNDFSVGGSLSVNVHARDITYGSLMSTVESIEVLLADGRLVRADRTENTDLFHAAIGGYGLMGIIVTATLSLTDNVHLVREIKQIDPAKYPRYFSQLSRDKTVVFQNADIFPTSFDEAVSITWRKTDKPLTTTDRFQTDLFDYIPQRTLESLIRRLPFLHNLRPLSSKLDSFEEEIVLRNYEMSYGINQLAMTSHHPTTMTLQEYFVPLKKYHQALEALTKVLTMYKVNVLNLSVRYVPCDNEAVLSYAPQDSFAFVLYISIDNTKKGKERMRKWTRSLINKIVSLNGSYYLPYFICATPTQFHRAYKQSERFREIKDIYDPNHRFKNMLWEKYFE